LIRCARPTDERQSEGHPPPGRSPSAPTKRNSAPRWRTANSGFCVTFDASPVSYA
jgi:hypothetical protein